MPQSPDNLFSLLLGYYWLGLWLSLALKLIIRIINQHNKYNYNKRVGVAESRLGQEEADDLWKTSNRWETIIQYLILRKC